MLAKSLLPASFYVDITLVIFISEMMALPNHGKQLTVGRVTVMALSVSVY